MVKRNNIKINNNKRLYESIMRDIKPMVIKALNECDETSDDKDLEEDDEMDEDVLNELFGFGSSDSVKKPEKALSLENSDSENAELFIQWIGYFMSKANNNVSKGLSMLFEKFGQIIIKLPFAIVKGVLMLMSASIKGVTFGVATVASVIFGSIMTLVKLTKQGVDKASEALTRLYKQISEGVKTFYKAFKANTKKYATDAKDTLSRWCGVMAAAVMAVANKIDGAVDHLADEMGRILGEAEEGIDAAVLAVKTWLSCKSKEVLTWISDTAGNIKNKVAAAWNKLDKNIRKGYNKTVEQLESWMTSIKDAIEFATQKVKETATKAKDFVIDKKDKTLIYGIQKAVKGLSDKFTEDQVVALVRKCYNESMRPMYNGNYMVNEKYFYNSRARRLRRI